VIYEEKKEGEEEKAGSKTADFCASPMNLVQPLLEFVRVSKRCSSMLTLWRTYMKNKPKV